MEDNEELIEQIKKVDEENNKEDEKNALSSSFDVDEENSEKTVEEQLEDIMVIEL